MRCKKCGNEMSINKITNDDYGRNVKWYKCSCGYKCKDTIGEEDDEVEKAIKLLKKNGYIIKKWTKSMEMDANECAEMEEKGISKDCCDCSCSVCLMQ